MSWGRWKQSPARVRCKHGCNVDRACSSRPLWSQTVNTKCVNHLHAHGSIYFVSTSSVWNYRTPFCQSVFIVVEWQHLLFYLLTASTASPHFCLHFCFKYSLFPMTVATLTKKISNSKHRPHTAHVCAQGENKSELWHSLKFNSFFLFFFFSSRGGNGL